MNIKFPRVSASSLPLYALYCSGILVTLSIITSNGLLGYTSIFSSNFLQSLKNKYLETELGNDRQLGNSADESHQLPNNMELPNFHIR